MAEREGFEPSKVLLLYTLSKRAPSTTRPPLQLIFPMIYHNKIILNRNLINVDVIKA